MDSFDVAVVGGGIAGVALAYHAALDGKKVALFERHEKPVGATIRNFGMVWPIGQPHDKLARALRSREIWLQLAKETGFWCRAEGSLHVAYTEDEWAVLEEFSTQAGERGYDVELVNRAKCRELSPHVVEDGLIGALYSRTEVNVDPRQALEFLHRYLAEQLNVRIHYKTAITAIDHPALTDGFREWKADRIFVASGEDITTLYPDWFAIGPLTQSKLQMLRTTAMGAGFTLGPNLAAGLTLLHYGSFRDCGSLPALRARMEEEMGDYLEEGIHVMVSATANNELTIGDSHEYGRDFSPFNSARINQMILDYLGRFFRVRELKIAETWNGVYTKTTDGSTEWVVSPVQGVTLVNGLGGAGMTLSFGLAEEIMRS